VVSIGDHRASDDPTNRISVDISRGTITRIEGIH
jgi:hypothetical protein